ncbi:hypothetical protein [Actinomadura violacea]|uniref:Uncharacterized protein n=1 Tax=Actinomadura violacea TaxID=2819934 RepID=A0ABS3RXW1_9ACTN|nr:hypothetical protein [Actinomadura violacea]MBO2461600.1 hypothetical protein [Actinomadura violacea]
MSTATMHGAPPSAYAAADLLAAEIERHHLDGRAFTRDGRAFTRASIPGAPSAHVDVECSRQGVSWCFATAYGAIGESPATAATYLAHLFGVAQ